MLAITKITHTEGALFLGDCCEDEEWSPVTGGRSDRREIRRVLALPCWGSVGLSPGHGRGSASKRM